MANALAWGFHRLRDIADQRVTDNIARVRTAVDEYIAFQTGENNGVVDQFSEQTTEVQAKFKLPGDMRLQPLTELGRPRPERYAEQEYSMAWPIQKAGLALGETYEQRIKMSIRQFAGIMQAVGLADLQWMRNHALAALFYNGAGWLHDDPDDPAGDLTIRGLANGDAQLYATTGGSTYLATDNHYAAQAADLLTASDPIPSIVDDLKEHPINSGEVVIIGSMLDKAKYTALASFYQERNPNLTVGSGVTQFTGTAPGSGLGEFLGYHLYDAYIYLWRGMPQGYMVGFMTGGPKPLRRREHAEPQLQGFKPEDNREDYPFYETPYVRRAGFGGWNRVGAFVQRFNNGAYAIPTNYTSPMP